ncbi:GerAB/ArcD/ProY family transporter [Paenibacillus castaneae]|uniref:GerAB/ArcD/ProY family transporter n=1 Tax=Paenibacillus castaneae TaxID=474957 RepID=UPI001FBA9C22|nr:endospore germination permease [Paenibacillus castaneae]
MHHIGIREASAIVIIFVITKIFLPFQRSLSEVGGTAAWIIILIAILFCPLTWWAVRGVLKNGPEQCTLVTATENILGPLLGNVVNLLYCIFFFMITFIVLREFSEIISSEILPRTPLTVILLSLLIPIAFITHLGIEAVGRISSVTIILIVGSVYILLIGGLITHMEPNALSPLWGTGRSHVLWMGVIKSSLFSELLVLGFLLPKMRNQKEWGKVAWWSITVSSIVLLSTTILYLYIFPYPTAARINVPLLQISKLIIFGRWLQRMESLFLIVWLICTVIKLAVSLYCTVSSLSQIIRLPRHQSLVFPITIIIFSFAMLPDSEMTAYAWDKNILRTYGSIISIGLPMLTWIVGIIRNKRRQV